MEEIFEAWTWRQLGYHRKALGLLNVAGYYDHLLHFLDVSQQGGFLWPDVQELLLVDDDIDALLDRLADEHMRLKAQTPPDQPETGPGGISPEI
jgi:predicted Rossmann-fold nucleotide-binding protein